jgi:hypothetical protein
MGLESKVWKFTAETFVLYSPLLMDEVMLYSLAAKEIYIYIYIFFFFFWYFVNYIREIPRFVLFWKYFQMYFLWYVIQGRLGTAWVSSVTITVSLSQAFCNQILLLKRQVLRNAGVGSALGFCSRSFLRRPVTMQGTLYFSWIVS